MCVLTCCARMMLCSCPWGLQDAAYGGAVQAPVCSRSAHFVKQLPTSDYLPHHCAVQDALRLAAQGCDALPAEVLAKLRAAAGGARPATSSQARAVDMHVGEA